MEPAKTPSRLRSGSPSPSNVLVAIIRKRLDVDRSLYQILQILSITILEKTPILRAFQAPDSDFELSTDSNQLILFDF